MGFPYILHTLLSLPFLSKQDATQFRADQILVRLYAAAALELDSIRAPAPRKGKGRTPIPLSRPLSLSSSFASGLIRSHLYSRGVSCNLVSPLLPLPMQPLLPQEEPCCYLESNFMVLTVDPLSGGGGEEGRTSPTAEGRESARGGG